MPKRNLTLHLTPEPDTNGGYKPAKVEVTWKLADGEPVGTVPPHTWVFKRPCGTVTGWELRDGKTVKASGTFPPLATCLGAKVSVEEIVITVE